MADKLKRSFVSDDLKIESFDDIKGYYDNLEERQLTSWKEIWQWLLDKSELESIVSEELAWRYIKMNLDTSNEEAVKLFNVFVTDIEPQISVVSNRLNRKFYTDEVLSKVDSTKLFTVIREVRKDIELFREENVSLEAELQQKEQEYGMIASKMTVNYNGEEMTLQKAANFLKETDRSIREEVYHLINKRRQQDAKHLNTLLSELIVLRHKIALNAGFSNYRDYKFRSMGRFDYTVEDCKEFHNTIAETVVPMVNELYEHRKAKLKYKKLKPWDLDVDEDLQPPLKPFANTGELIKNTTLAFRDVEPEFGVYLNEMKHMGHLDLDSRKNKAPGGFNYPLHESNVPFIYMNATGNLRDVVTLMHEGGHAVHSYLTAKLELVDFKDTPSEVAELASMSMELISMDHWHYFFDKEEDLKRAQRIHLEDVLTVLPWVATVDKFQHFLYENPEHTVEERSVAWIDILDELGSDVIDFSGLETYRKNQWQKQLHIFEVPFYYIEYGMAQLGAIAIWKNYKENPDKTISNFKEALKMGYTSPIPHIYEKAGIKFDFSKEYISELMTFVKEEWRKLI